MYLSPKKIALICFSLGLILVASSLVLRINSQKTKKAQETPIPSISPQPRRPHIAINQGKIVEIYANVPAPSPNTLPYQLKSYPAHQPVDYVLETSAGWSEKNHIQVGDSVKISL